MFSFLKNIFGSSLSSDSQEKQAAPEYDKTALEQELAALRQQIEKQKDVDMLNKLGSVCAKLAKTDEAIKYYEESLSIQPSLGKASTDLLKLYNIKRKEAAATKDDDLIQFYLDKIDNLMKMNKETMKKNSTY